MEERQVMTLALVVIGLLLVALAISVTAWLKAKAEAENIGVVAEMPQSDRIFNQHIMLLDQLARAETIDDFRAIKVRFVGTNNLKGKK